MTKAKYRDVWPIDHRSGNPPKGWKGWPDGKRFALVLTHDVESEKGQEKCLDLMVLEQELGFRSSFNFVPKRYEVSSNMRSFLACSGFEVGVHGLYHDGKYYQSRDIFRRRAIQINEYLRQWNAVGFRSPSMLHNLEWIHDLDIDYDMSTFDTDPFEPQPDGVGTIFPFFVKGKEHGRGYVELPCTLPQDFTLFILMREETINIWKKKLDWIVEMGGMALMNVHPDYINFTEKKRGMQEYPAGYYSEFLEYIKDRYGDQCWHVLPKEIASYCQKHLSDLDHVRAEQSCTKINT